MAKDAYINQNGSVCQICGFDFHKTYGDIGRNYIEAHHTKPVSEMKEGDVTRIEDLAMVCANCHRMLHRKKPLLKPHDLKNYLNKKFMSLIVFTTETLITYDSIKLYRIY